MKRKGDGAKMARIEYIDKDKIPTEEQIAEYRAQMRQAVLDERQKFIEQRRKEFEMEKKE